MGEDINCRYMRLTKAADATIASAKPGTPIPFVAVTPGVKRDGMDTGWLPWRVDNYRANPVVTWAHDFIGTRLPIGRAEVELEDGPAGETIRALVTFDADDEFAAEVERKYRGGWLHALSASWDDIDDKGLAVRVSGAKPVAHDLLELAAVPVPGDPAALMEREMAGMRALRDGLDALLSDARAPSLARIDRGAIPPHETPKADEGEEWDAGAEVKAAEGEDQLRRMHAWVDSDGDPDAKSSYKLPHHRADGTLIWRGTAAAMAALLGGRGGVDIPEDDVGAVYRHLARHYEQYDREPPELRRGSDDATAPIRNNRRASDSDEDWHDAAAAMVDVFDRAGSIDSDDQRRRAYRALLAAYRRAGREPPEFIPMAELAELDDANWRALFLAGEPDLVASRVSKVLARQNEEDIREALRLLSGVLSRHEAASKAAADRTISDPATSPPRHRKSRGPSVEEALAEALRDLMEDHHE